jgi:hypothetical protein
MKRNLIAAALVVAHIADGVRRVRAASTAIA